MALRIYDGKLLTDSGSLATSDDCCCADMCCELVNCFDSQDRINVECDGTAQLGDVFQVGEDCYMVDILDVPCDTPVTTDNTCATCEECPCECTDGNCTRFEKCSDSSEYELGCEFLPNGLKTGDVVIVAGECYTITARDTACSFDPALPGSIDAGKFATCEECEASLFDCECCTGGLQGMEITISGFEDFHTTSDPGDNCGWPDTNPSGCGCTGVNGTWLVPTTYTPPGLNPHGFCNGGEDFNGNVDCTGYTDPDCTWERRFYNSTMRLDWIIRKNPLDATKCEFGVDLLVGCTIEFEEGGPDEGCNLIDLRARGDISDFNPDTGWVACDSISGSDTGFGINFFNLKCRGDDATISWSAY